MANTNIQTAPQNSETRPTGYRVWRIVTSVTLRNGQFAKNPFPTAMHEMEDDDGFDGDGWRAIPVRSLFMAQIEDLIRDKPNWQEKMLDQEIWKKWMEEVGQNEEITPAMELYIHQELEYWAKRMSPEDGIVPSIDDVWKSDTLISPQLKADLRNGAAVLEDAPEKEKDWHPNTNETVLNLIHPSLFPIMYGISGRVEGPIDYEKDDFISKCAGAGTPYYDSDSEELDSEQEDDSPVVDEGDNSDGDDSDAGQGTHGPGQGPYQINSSSDNGRPTRKQLERLGGGGGIAPFRSNRYCWLPTDFSLSQDGTVHALGYINNLHPKEHAPLYKTITTILGRCVPLWEHVLTSIINEETLRTPDNYNPWRQGTIEELDTVPQKQWKYASRQAMLEEFIEYQREGYRTYPYLKLEDAVEFNPPVVKTVVKLSDFGQLQVIVKMANIMLTPEKPTYEGGSWHVEGAENESIVATAIYYYDSENVEENKLHFRQAVRIPSYEQNDYSGIVKAYGIGRKELNQYRGYITTREDRVIGFSNAYQHRVSSFSLKDKTKPGHRKILCFFLVDPFTTIPSTTQIPPQRQDWWTPEVSQIRPFADLPAEIQMNIFDRVPYPMSLEVAKKHREALMKERTRVQRAVHANYVREYTLCEH